MMASQVPMAGTTESLRHDVAQRPGAITLLALVATICLMSLGILAIGMSDSAMATASARARSVEDAYRCEASAQGFVARLCDAMAQEGATPADAVGRAVSATLSGGGAVEAEVGQDGTCHASFPCGDTRELDVTIAIGEGGDVMVTGWVLRALPSEEVTMGSLVEL